MQHSQTLSGISVALLKINQLTNMNPSDMNALEYAAYVRFSLFLLIGGCTLILACFAVSIHSDYRKSNRK